MIPYIRITGNGSLSNTCLRVCHREAVHGKKTPVDAAHGLVQGREENTPVLRHILSIVMADAAGFQTVVTLPVNDEMRTLFIGLEIARLDARLKQSAVV